MELRVEPRLSYPQTFALRYYIDLKKKKTRGKCIFRRNIGRAVRLPIFDLRFCTCTQILIVLQFWVTSICWQPPQFRSLVQITFIIANLHVQLPSWQLHLDPGGYLRLNNPKPNWPFPVVMCLPQSSASQSMAIPLSQLFKSKPKSFLTLSRQSNLLANPGSSLCKIYLESEFYSHH